MKISYIIMPFENPEYLIRCVNSLYRQLGSDYEVILGENFFWCNALEKNSGEVSEDSFGELKEFLKDHTRLVKISPCPESGEEKLKEAFSLVSEDSDYVMLIDVNTVVAPAAAQAILGSGGGALIIPAAAVRKGDGFEIDMQGKKDLLKNLEQIPPQRLCYGRDLFKRLDISFFESQECFSAFIIRLFTEQIKITTVDEICIYSQPFSTPERKTQEFETVRENSSAILDRLFDIRDTEVQILIFERLIIGLAAFMGSAEYEVREAAWSALKAVGSTVKDSFLFRRFFEGKIGFDLQDVLSLTYDEYVVYKECVVGRKAEGQTAAADTVRQEKMIKELGSAVEAVKKELDTIRKDIAGLARSQNQAVAAVIGANPNDSNPALHIPQMYREGRLGLKTIIRSFGGWLKYKFSRKKG